MAVSKTNFPVLNDRIPCYRKTGNCAPIYCDDCVFRGHIQRQLRVLSIVTGGWKWVPPGRFALPASPSDGREKVLALRREWRASNFRRRAAAAGAHGTPSPRVAFRALPHGGGASVAFSPEHPNREIRDDRQKPGQPRGRGRVRPRARAACRFRFAGGPIRREGGGRGFCTVRRSERVRE